MAFLPQTMLPKARRYLDAERMRAADLIIAKGLLDQNGSKPGALSIFTRDHLDPARAESAALREKIDQLDDIDLQGWLARLLLLEYLRLGEALHPSEPDAEAARDVEEFARWLSRLAARTGTTTHPAVELIAEDLEGDGRIASTSTFRYALRPDFKARYGLDRKRATISCLRRRRTVNDPPDEVDADLEEVASIQVEAFEPPPLSAPQEILFEEDAPGTRPNSD